MKNEKLNCSMGSISFSRDKLTEFVDVLQSQVARIDISILPDGDEAVLYPPFSNTALILKEGDCVTLGDVVPDSFPERRFVIATRNT